MGIIILQEVSIRRSSRIMAGTAGNGSMPPLVWAGHVTRACGPGFFQLTSIE